VKKTLGIIGIVILGLLLRLICIDKPDGLWNDEYVSWIIASTPFANGFIDAVKSQCHMPFYYLYLKFFMTILGQSDLALRLTSVFAGVIAIPVMYFLGKEKNERTGYYCAVFCAISSFLIYYSQEIRLYSVLFLFSALCLLYTQKLIKNPNKKNVILCILFNFLILFTHTIGFVFVFFNLIYISFKNKKTSIYIWSSLALCSIMTSPLAIKILTTKSFSQWWGHFSISKIGFLFTDYFSPVLTNLTNAPDNFLYMPKLAPLMIIPALIAVILIIRSLKKECSLFLLACSFLSILVIASMLGKLVFITKYSIEIYPILIYLACVGLSTINNKIIKNIIIVFYCFISLGYILIFPYSAPKMRRSEGHKIPMDMLKRMEIKKDDIILLEYYPKERFEKYFDFNDYRVISIDKGNFPEYLNSTSNYSAAYKSGKTLYKEIFSSMDNKYLDNLIKNRIFDNLKQDQSVVMVLLDSVSFYSPDDLSKITQSKELYNKEPLLFLVFSYIKNKTFEDIVNTLTIMRLERKGSWTVIKFTKLNK
jgi:hypothetical protein